MRLDCPPSAARCFGWLSDDEIAAAHGVSRSTVERWRYAVDAPSYREVRNDWRIAALHSVLAQRGPSTVAELAAGVDSDMVRSWLKRLAALGLAADTGPDADDTSRHKHHVWVALSWSDTGEEDDHAP